MRSTPGTHNPDAPVKAVTVHRLSAQAFEQVRQKMPGIVVTNDTTPLQAGFQLGLQRALEIIRQEITLED